MSVVWRVWYPLPQTEGGLAMPATVFERHFQDRVQSIRQFTQPWTEHPVASGQEFKDLAALCLTFPWQEAALEMEFKQIYKQPDLTVAWLLERRQAIEEPATMSSLF